MGIGRSISQTRDLEQFAHAVRSHFDTARADVNVTAAAEDGANTREFTLQVIDRLKNPWPGRWRVWLFLAATQDGAPSATGNTFALSSGTILQTVTANAQYHLLTDTDGALVFTLQLGAGAATRYVYADIDGQVLEFGPFSWT